MKIKEIPLQNQPRERLLNYGAKNLSDAELLAIILQKGSKKENVIDMCNRLISNGDLSEMSLTKMQEIKGIGPAKAMQIIALFEFAKRQKQSNKNKILSKPEDVFELMKHLQNSKKEHFYGIYLDVRNKIIERPELLSIGILDASIIHPREVFHQAIKKNAKSVILVHNHPSGDTTPSKEDIEITELLYDSSRILNIQLLDHIIIGNSWYSFRDSEMMK